jgi:hypothetical protein
MKTSHWLVGAVGLTMFQGCTSSPSGGSPAGDAGGSDSTAQPETGGGEEAGAADAMVDATPAADAGSADGGASDASEDAGSADGGASDASEDAGSADGGGDAIATGADACTGDWLDTSSLYPGITPDAGAVILHAAGSGTQNYECEGVADDGGTSYAWTFTGPQANLDDCTGTLIGHHFASEAGASAPEWETLDDTYVIGSKKVSYTPDGGASSIPWLLLQATAHGGTGTLSNANWISRANTAGGVAPTTACGASNVGTTQDIDYTADYYFWGP